MESRVTIRPARPEDAPGVARVHVDSWRETYLGIVPEDFLASLSYERREQMWRSGLENPDWQGALLVAEEPTGGIVGFVVGGPPQEPDGEFACELWAIYLLRAYQGRGIGRQLFQRFVQEMVRRGHTSMLLWVLAENPTTRFYQRMGGVKVGEKEIELSGKKLLEWAYGWRNLKRSET
ncbi:MAG TPA: GNAT family N-acetyltransferase [Meiothermus sp.]|nr:GNAT family N-acetyltransferase [Meiothermus sp.]